MAHIRKQIRAAVAALLSGETDAGTRVYTSQAYNIATLPAITVETPSEESDLETTTSLIREVEIVIEGFLDSTVNDSLDDMAEAIETAMATDQKLGGLCLVSWLAATNMEKTEEADKPHGKITLTYKAQYRSAV